MKYDISVVIFIRMFGLVLVEVVMKYYHCDGDLSPTRVSKGHANRPLGALLSSLIRRNVRKNRTSKILHVECHGSLVRCSVNV